MIPPALPLVCISGTLCDARLFAPMLARIERSAQLWLLDAHDRVEAAAAALLHSVSGPFVALGFSLGGFVAIEAMRQQPDRVRGLVLVSGNAFPDAPVNAATRRADVEAGRETGLAQWMAARAALLFPRTCAGREALVTLVTEMASTAGDEVHRRQTEMNIHRPDLRAVVAAAQQPILALAGSEDTLCPAERYEDLTRTGTARLEVIAGAGHYLPLEAPARCAASITNFLKVNRL